MNYSSARLKKQSGNIRITCDLPLFKPFSSILTQVIKHHSDVFSLTLNYQSHKAELNGYRPVEIRLEKQPDNNWSICYITEFYYSGLSNTPKLEPFVDFDFSMGTGHQADLSPESITTYSGLFSLWQRNFCRYYSYGVYQQHLSIEEK
ncbi:DUF2787 domain-containing protein [Jinshanibacter sp. LJY008]|uniref:DUF2787 domain-containing protein n=1 Tax=Limnobaculum eriocheiris TaxID=2897391 RepID=A0A9X1MVX9_9GAMM|nr:DUF2787 family protein [Limnobaculum eriocheiris]MCD1125605.1 DUF2787 domain-containing protein [Limnobaculum eriocheiris]